LRLGALGFSTDQVVGNIGPGNTALPGQVCDDAELQNAVTWTIGSAFSNAGQRCAAGSRIIVFDAVYDRFKDLLVERTTRLKVGTGDTDDYGPVINEEQMRNMLAAVDRAKAAGASAVIMFFAPRTGGAVRGQDPLCQCDSADSVHWEGYFPGFTVRRNGATP